MRRSLCRRLGVSFKVSDVDYSVRSARDLLPLAGASAIAQSGGTVVLATAVASTAPWSADGFLPLTVDFRTKAAATGHIPRSGNRREMISPSNGEVLAARAIDRCLRPVFAKGFGAETQVCVSVQAEDGSCDAVALGVQAAAAALATSDLPFGAPPGAVRVARVDGKLKAAPTERELATSDLDLLYAGRDDRCLMIELCGDQLSDAEVQEAIRFAHKHIQPVQAALDRLRAEDGRETRAWSPKAPPAAAAAAVEHLRPRAVALFAGEGGGRAKGDFGLAQAALAADLRAAASGAGGAAAEEAEALAEGVMRDAFRAAVLEGGARADGRGAGEVRPLSCAAGVLPGTHGSATFSRGQTQVLATATLGAPLSALPLEKRLRSGKWDNGFNFLHYDFPPYATDEVGRFGAPGRRSIGHGALAERALLPVMPERDAFGHADGFPYVSRAACEVTASNGSSSMASACAASLALMDAGVPVAAAVGGVSVGLVSGGGTPALLTDIQGLEDHYGDMDLKVAGTKAGVTAVQLDVKLPGGVPLDLLLRAISGPAAAGREEVLRAMDGAIAAPRAALAASVPRVEQVHFAAEKERELKGDGNATRHTIEQRYGVSLDIRPEGVCYVSSNEQSPLHGTGVFRDRDAANGAVGEAASLVEELVAVIAEGDVFEEATVLEVQDFGAVVEVLRGHEGFLHVSEVIGGALRRPLREMLAPGQRIRVRVIEVSKVLNTIRLSRRQAMTEEELAGDDLHADYSAVQGDETVTRLESFLHRIPNPPSRHAMAAVRMSSERRGLGRPPAPVQGGRKKERRRAAAGAKP